MGEHVTVEVKEIFLLDATCLHLQIERITILAIYRSPSIVDASRFVSSLNDYLETSVTCNSVVVVGDININLIPWDNEPSVERRNRYNYLEMLAVHNIMPGHNLTTRGKSSLDHIMIKIDKTKIAAQIAVLSTSITDHMMVILRVNGIATLNTCKKTKQVTSYGDACEALANKNLTELLLCRDPELVVQGLITKITLSIKENSKTVIIPKSKRVLKP